jgi:hypothetical protein
MFDNWDQSRMRDRYRTTIDDLVKQHLSLVMDVMLTLWWCGVCY